MSKRRLALKAVHSVFLLVAISALCSTLLVGGPPTAALFTAVFIIFGVFPAWAIGAIAIPLISPRNYPGLTGLLLLALLAGVFGSWRVQTIRPFDFHHEADGSMPGWEPVMMYSWTTVRCCVSAVVATFLTYCIIQAAFRPRKLGAEANWD